MSTAPELLIDYKRIVAVLKPMTAKIKTTIQRSTVISSGNNNEGANNRNHKEDASRISKISSDVVVQDCNLQISKSQYESILSTYDSLKRMYVTWNYLSMRPTQRIFGKSEDESDQNAVGSKAVKSWWRYAYSGCLEQRVRPYYWSRIRMVRRNYRTYCEIYKKILLNPKDTELKLDLQQYEDKLSVVNIVIARQHTKLMVRFFFISSKVSTLLLLCNISESRTLFAVDKSCPNRTNVDVVFT